MRKYIFILVSLLCVLSACNVEKKAEMTRTDKILAELNDPNSKYVAVISHRGDWRNYPENSIPAIESVIRMGVDIMELDVKMTKDSVLVLCHDTKIDRTTNGKGYVRDMTYDSLMTFKLKRAHGITTDSLRMPTLRQALLTCKDRILVNVDHGYSYYKEVVELADELGMTGQVLMKGTKSIDRVNEDMSKHKNNLLYMPIVNPHSEGGKALFNDYVQRGIVPMAFEVCWSKPGEEIDGFVEKIHQMGSKLWINTFWPSVCGGYGNDDDAAIDAADPADVYGQYIKMGASMIQTDRPALVLSYLRSIGRHD